MLATKSNSGGGDKKKRKRKRKRAPQTDTAAAAATKTTNKSSNADPTTTATTTFIDNEVKVEHDLEEEEIDISTIKDVASFSFKGGGDSGNINDIDTLSQTINQNTAPSAATSSAEKQDGYIPLPDIKDTLRRKDLGSNKGRMEEEQDSGKKKIDRRDKKALLKLLEQDPYADADESFFEEQEYTTVSALLGERAKPFLGIPTGPLQVGHFIGALVIVLMAFIEYPGFPLTNLPSPLRGALQGGLGIVYGINFVLAIFAAFKAGERGQPAALWIGKVLTVGGLAFDQFTQLPTLEEVEAVKARKGKRALKNKNNRR